jgi:TnpA family transposase
MKRYIGADHLPRGVSEFDVDTYFRLPKETIEAIQERFRPDRRLGPAIQVAFLRASGRPLDAFKVVPAPLLSYLGRAVGARAPTLASLRGFYKRRETLSEHQLWARRHLGIADFGKAKSADLVAMLKAQAAQAASVDELVTSATHWLHEKKILIPADRTLRDLAREAFADVSQLAIATVRGAMSASAMKACINAVFSVHESGGTVLEWLKTAPKRHSKATLDETLRKIRYLKELGAHEWNLSAITIPRQRAYALALRRRPPAETKRRVDETQMVEIICFLHCILSELADSVLFQTHRRTTDLLRHAKERTAAHKARTAGEYRQWLITIRGEVDDTSRTPTERLKSISGILDELGDLSVESDAKVHREFLIEDSVRIRALLSAVRDLDFTSPENDRALSNLKLLHGIYAAEGNELPADADVQVDKRWEEVVSDHDRQRALKALQASTALGLSRGLRRGSICVAYSMSFREKDQMLIPPDEWERDRDRYLQLLKLDRDPDVFLTKVGKHVEAGLVAVAEARKAGKLEIKQGMLHLPPLAALSHEVDPKEVGRLLFEHIGDVQFPDLLLEVDSLTNFSEVLLGRRAVDANELTCVYAALIAHGTEIDAKSVSAMIPGLDPAHVSAAMQNLESPTRLRKANQRVAEFQQRHAIAEKWGKGAIASSDGMSIDASPHLWNARVDPRRRQFAVGVYTHVRDTWGIVYDQPVVLNRRQAGPALEGALRHNATREEEATKLLKLAVDTHGYTYVGMAFAKLSQLDLCPRLKDLDERKLFVLRSMETPEGLEGVVIKDVSLRSIRKGWDELCRWVASVYSGRISAPVAMERLGSGAVGVVKRAADQLGKLLRTWFLCDYFTNEEFRREMHMVLNRGESVHQLQRAVYYGKIAPERGRRRDELIAISGSHVLLTNCVLAWNTYHIQRAVEEWRRSKRPIDDAILRHIGPARFGHINFRGTFRFGIERYRQLLLQPGKSQRIQR